LISIGAGFFFSGDKADGAATGGNDSFFVGTGSGLAAAAAGASVSTTSFVLVAFDDAQPIS